MIPAVRNWFCGLTSCGVYPVERGAIWVKRHIGERISALFYVQKNFSRIRELEIAVDSLRVEALLLEQISEENRLLRESLQLPVRDGYVVNTTTILSFGGAGGWWREIRISIPRNSKIAVGDAVISRDGLVGTIAKIDGLVATVRLITDPNSHIACAVSTIPGTPAVRGILQGAGWSSQGNDVADFLYVYTPPSLDYMERNATIFKRAKVTTSGLSASIPGGISVGDIITSAVNPDGLYQSGQVSLAVDFSSLSVSQPLYVLVPKSRGYLQ